MLKMSVDGLKSLGAINELYIAKNLEEAFAIIERNA